MQSKTLTPLFQMERDTMESAQERIKRLVLPIFEEAAKEAPTNQGLVGSVFKNSEKTILWQPHNYRLYFDFTCDSSKPFTPPNQGITKVSKSKGVGSKQDVIYKSINHGKNHYFGGFHGCNITVLKSRVRVTNMMHHKQWRMLTGSVRELCYQIDAVIKEMDAQCVDALKKFLQRFGGSSKFEMTRPHCDHSIKGDEFLDSVPREFIIRGDSFKKVYNEKVEFYSPAHVKKYIENRALEDFSPVICEELRANRKVLYDFQEFVIPVMRNFAQNMNAHVDVMQLIASNQRKFNALLDVRQKKLGDYFS